MYELFSIMYVLLRVYCLCHWCQCTHPSAAVGTYSYLLLVLPLIINHSQVLIVVGLENVSFLAIGSKINSSFINVAHLSMGSGLARAQLRTHYFFLVLSLAPSCLPQSFSTENTFNISLFTQIDFSGSAFSGTKPQTQIIKNYEKMMSCEQCASVEKVAR